MTMVMISIVAAVDKNGAIGSNGRPLWTGGMPADERHFRSLTAGGTVIMGRKAFETFHGLLPGRQNIVISHYFQVRPGVVMARNLKEAFKESTESDINIIGGASIFDQAMEYADRLYITEVDHQFDEADAFFPNIDLAIWREARRESHPAEGGNKYPYSFLIYDRMPTAPATPLEWT